MKSIFIRMMLVMNILFFTKYTVANEKDNALKIKITSNGLEMMATLNDTSTAKDFISKLPVKLKMKPHQNREYYSEINLDKKEKTQDKYEIGDIGYWVPGKTLVLFYDTGYTGDLIIMGKIDTGLKQLKDMGNRFDAIIELAK